MAINYFHPSGAVPWTMVPELFLQETRSVAVTIATIVNWMASFVVGFVFPYILVSRSELRKMERKAGC